MRIKLIDRYMLTEVSGPFFGGLAAFLMVLCLNMAYFVLDLMVSKGASLALILRIIALRVPLFLVLAMPVAILVSSSLAMNRITRDREIVALRLAGLSLWRILAPFFIAGVALSAAAFVTEEYITPLTNHVSDTLYRELILSANVPSLTPDTFYPVDNKVFYFHRAHRSGEHTLEMQQVLMYQMNGTSFPDVWTAREAEVNGDVWTLKGVVMHHLDEKGRASLDVVPHDASGQNNLVLNLHKDMSLFAAGEKDPEELTAAELKAKIDNLERLGIHDLFLDQELYDYHSKFAIPFACLICALIGIPLNIRYARHGGFVGLFLALVSIFVYYNCMLFARSLAYNGSIPPVLGAWFPDFLFGIICLIFITREL